MHSKIAIFVFLFWAALGWPTLNGSNDFQLWVNGGIQKKMSPNVVLNIANEYRFGNNISEYYYTFLQAIIGYQWNEWLSIKPGYRQIWVRGAKETHFHLVYEPLMDFIFQKPNRWNVRQRVSYLFDEAAPNRFLYRARIQLLSGRAPLYPYLSNEIFIFSRRGFSQDRIIIGINPKIYKTLSLDFYYLLRFLKGTEWNLNHIFGTTFSAKF